MKKVIILGLFILLITGCKVDYNLIINEDLTVRETVNMTGTDEFFDSFYRSSRMNVVKMLLEEGRKDDLIKSGYQYEIKDALNPYVVANKSYTNLEEFSKQTIFLKQYFDSLNVSKENGIISMQTKNFNPIIEDSIDRYVIRFSKVSITVPYEVTENNAKSYDRKTNTYIWYIDDKTENFSLLLSYDTNKIYEIPDENDWLTTIIYLIVVMGLVVVAVILNKKNK